MVEPPRRLIRTSRGCESVHETQEDSGTILMIETNTLQYVSQSISLHFQRTHVLRSVGRYTCGCNAKLLYRRSVAGERHRNWFSVCLCLSVCLSVCLCLCLCLMRLKICLTEPGKVCWVLLDFCGGWENNVPSYSLSYLIAKSNRR